MAENRKGRVDFLTHFTCIYELSIVYMCFLGVGDKTEKKNVQVLSSCGPQCPNTRTKS